MNICFLFGLQSAITLLILQMFQLGLWEPFQLAPVSLGTILIFVFFALLLTLLALPECPHSSHIFPAPGSRNIHFSKEPQFF